MAIVRPKAIYGEGVPPARTPEQAGRPHHNAYRKSAMPEDLPLPLDAPLDLSDPADRCDAAQDSGRKCEPSAEAVRVLEDFARFSLNDAFLSRQLKELRHDLARTLGVMPSPALLAGRDTISDVGTAISTDGEHTRRGLRDVVAANAKRLQEALRSLEEYGKFFGERYHLDAMSVAERLEALRYQSYTLERALLLRSDAGHRLATAELYVLLTGARLLRGP